MPDWTRSMQQSFEYYIVDPGTWTDVSQLHNVKSCTITWDAEADTLGSAIIDVTDLVGEHYIRVYLITVQDGLTEKHPLGTFMAQTPSSSFDGKVGTVSMDAYTPLIELKEKHPPIGYSIFTGENIMDMAYQLTRENIRSPVVRTTSDDVLHDDFVSEIDDKWVTFLNDLIAKAKYSLSLDEMGRVLFAPIQDTASLVPSQTFDDSNSSILYPEISIKQDLYDLPNVVEVIYSTSSESYYARVVNDDPNSPISTVNRGREIVHRETNPSFSKAPSQDQIDDYAEQLLRELSSVECMVSYTHGYCGVRLGDCIFLNYEKAKITGVKAKVISQSIKCEPGCPVSEKAVFTTKLWG